jgi:Type II secretion system (T2SS), protein M subtype b
MRDLLSNLLARFNSASRQERLYYALAVVSALFILRFGVSWLRDYRAEVKEDIQATADRIARYQRDIGRAPEISRSLEALRIRYKETVSQLVPGDSPTLAAAALQERISSLASQKNISIQTTQVMKDEQVGPFKKVALRITASAELRDFADFLSALEYGPLRVSIPFIEVTRRGAVVRGQTPRAVSATLEVAGIIQGVGTGIEAAAGPTSEVSAGAAVEAPAAVPASAEAPAKSGQAAGPKASFRKPNTAPQGATQAAGPAGGGGRPAPPTSIPPVEKRAKGAPPVVLGGGS